MRLSLAYTMPRGYPPEESMLNIGLFWSFPYLTA